MADQDIFSQASDQGTSNQTPNDTQGQSTSDTGQYLATLVGESRKYKTADELAKAYINIDEFVARLKDENAKLKEQMNESKTVQDVLDRLNAEDRQTTHDQGETKTGDKPSLSATEVATIVRDTLTGLETQRSKNENLKLADAAMRKLFGDKAADVFNKEASTPEMRKALMELAAVSPEKFVSVFHKPSAGGSQVDSSSAVNTATLENTPVEGRVADSGCKEFYDTLRRTNPKAYYSSAIQLQMTKAAEADPNKFFNRRS